MLCSFICFNPNQSGGDIGFERIQSSLTVNRETTKAASNNLLGERRWNQVEAAPAGACFREWIVQAILLLVCLFAGAQQRQEAPPGPAATRAPKTSPATEAILSSYEGQKVTGIQIAGQPDAKTSDYASLSAQHAGE